jgi:thiol-disulfide isomerase/thioredoxin
MMRPESPAARDEGAVTGPSRATPREFATRGTNMGTPMHALRNLAVALCLVLALSAGGGAAAEAVDFRLDGLDGREHRLSDYRGKWVVVNYWATWCPPCLEEMPELEIFHNAHRESALVLGVNMETIERDALRAFVEEQFVSYPILLDTPRPRTELGAIPGMPTTYLVSPAGEVVARQVGTVTREMLERFIEAYDATH